MKAISKLLFCLICASCFIACNNNLDGEINQPAQDELKGIDIFVSNSFGKSDGLGIACNFIDIFREHLTDEEIRKFFRSGNMSQDLTTEEALDSIEKTFTIHRNNMFSIVAGDELKINHDFGLRISGETFSITWATHTQVLTEGIYEAFHVNYNPEEPNDLLNESILGEDDITVNLQVLNDDVMSGIFFGSLIDDEGNEKEISGSFNVDRVPCNR